MHLFTGVHYYLSSSLSSQRQAELAHVLDNNGGSHINSIASPILTHLITNTNRYEGWQDVAAREEAGELAVVTVNGTLCGYVLLLICVILGQMGGSFDGAWKAAIVSCPG